MIVFGGYVRDRDILGLKTFNDLDIMYFKNNNYNSFITMINLCGFMKELCDNSVLPYGVMTKLISSVVKVKIVGIHGKRFPESMHFSIDLVKFKNYDVPGQTTIHNWKAERDTDFSCNLFYKDHSGIHLRYVPDNIYIGNVDPFTFWKNMTISRKFYPVLGNIDNLNSAKIFRLHHRSTKFVRNGWKMMYCEHSPFTIGYYRNIKLKNRPECAVCISSFKKNTIITNTICKHSFCSDCFQSVLLHTNIDIIPSCPTCRCKLSKNDIQVPFSDID